MSIPGRSESGFYGWKNAAFLFVLVLLAIGINNNAYTVTFASMIASTGWSRGEAGMAHSLNMLLGGGFFSRAAQQNLLLPCVV